MPPAKPRPPQSGAIKKTCSQKPRTAKNQPQGTPVAPKAASAPKVVEGRGAVRLNKAIAASGLCSRRSADQLILGGRVCVNGLPEPNPARQIQTSDRIEVDGRPLAAPQAFVYLLLHKPVQVVCTVSDPEGRPTVLDCLAEQDRALRLYPVGRLDYFSEGLLLLTNDGELAQRLTHPRHHQPRTYEVLVRGAVPEDALQTMRRGMRLAEGEDVLPVDVEAAPQHDKTLLRMVLHQGLNRQIRRMCRDLGLTILRLRRVAQGPLTLDNLAPGQARSLTQSEVGLLRFNAGLTSRA